MKSPCESSIEYNCSGKDEEDEGILAKKKTFSLHFN